MRLLYDIETNGLEPDKIHCLVAKDIDKNTIYKFSDEDISYPGIYDGIRLLQTAEVLIGHNIISFDNYWIKQLYNIDLYKIKCYDTLIMSQVLRYKRGHSHGMAAWGEKLGNSKIQFDNWYHYSKEMLRYCVQDVNVNHDIFNELMQEYTKIYNNNKLIKEGLKIEHDAAIFNAQVREQGWNFDKEKAEENLKKMRSKMATIEARIEPKLGQRTIYIDKISKTPKYTKSGNYTATTARLISEYLGREVKNTDTHVMAAGTLFRRSRVEDIKLGSMDAVKDWLLSIGWKPDEYQKKKVGFEWITTSPKLTTTSLKKLGETGEMIDEYYTLRNRCSVIDGWLSNMADGRLHGNMWTIGTPTFRCRHETIVNLPAVNARYGKELRELFKADNNWILVGADSSGNQLRGLCHYVNNPDFTHEVIYGDQHQRNADLLECDRPTAKEYLYAYLFGAGDAKLGQVLTGKANSKIGKDSKEKFAKGIKGLQELRDKLGKVWRKTYYEKGDGWFPAIDGRPVFCPGEHQTLNYLLQSLEGITCKSAVSYAMDKIASESLRALPRLFYHDEVCYTCHPDDADRVGQILTESFREAPKLFGIKCMDGGDYQVGDNYSIIH